MKYNKLYGLFIVLAGLLFATSCTDDDFGSDIDIQPQSKIQLAGEIDQVYVTRVNDEGFCDKDEIGIYITDYDGTTPGELKNSGNRADNLLHTYNEAENKWVPARDVFWKDKYTNVDIYGYYPFSRPENVNDYAFEVAKDQREAVGNLGGYEASDFLWGKAENIAPTDQVVRLKFKHKMASLRVTLVEGTGFAAGEWAGLDKSVLVMNTIRKSSIDLSNGNVTAIGGAPEDGIIPVNSGADYRAIVVPQTIAAGAPLFGITVGGVSYKFKKAEAFVYNQSKQHNFSITINKKEGGGLEFVVGNESITAWENDDFSHDAVSRAYVVINCPEYGKLKESIIAAKKDYTTLKNLKITGKINAADFDFMYNEMPKLYALNLKEVRVENDEIPERAMSRGYNMGKESLMRLVLPDKLKVIGASAFFECKYLVGSLIIPEGVTRIEAGAFHTCSSLTGSLSLPSTLEYIGGNHTLTEEGAFEGCGFTGNLYLPESLKIIDVYAFDYCSGFTGPLNLPSNLEKIGFEAFANCSGFTGPLRIPEKTKVIEESAFYSTNFKGTLTLPNNLLKIGNSTFYRAGLRGELHLPDEITAIPSYAFEDNSFSGRLVIPETVTVIGNDAFRSNRFMGELVIPKEVAMIGDGAFGYNSFLESVVFEDGVETIGKSAFENCFGIGRIVCKSTTPPKVQPGAFDGVPKDNFTLEVPEAAIPLYQTADGWREFKRIAAYRNFVVRPQVATAINTSVTRKLVLNADGPWTVESKPDWVTLDKTSGDMKVELKLTFAEMPKGSANREGEVVFKLTDKDYRTRCKVTQYDYQYAEDEVITLQSATKGKGVNIMIVGDGYSAKDISEGLYLKDMQETMKHFFAIEPYITYKDYFNVYTGIAVSAESGIGNVNTIVHNRFNTTFMEGVKLGPRYYGGDKEILEYATKAPTISNANLGETLIIMVPNTYDYGGVCYMYEDGCAIAYCPKSNDDYPFDFRGIVQHEAGGHGFGKLADEYIYHNAFIDACNCKCCPHVDAVLQGHALGWYSNVAVTGKANEVPWSHFIYHPKYHTLVDIFEGAFFHTRGAYRSEQNSCMNNNIPYYSAVSREAMVKRIMKIAGEPYSFEEFVKNDNTNAAPVTSRSVLDNMPMLFDGGGHHNAPVIIKNRPQVK